MTADPTVERLKAHLSEITRVLPSVWRQAEDFRLARGRDGLPAWPSWCYLPLAASYAIISGGGDNRISYKQASMVGPLGALIAWRATQGVYRFDPDVFRSLWGSPLAGKLPIEELYHLPEWCVYVECPRDMQDRKGLAVHGFFAYLEFDVASGRAELRLILDAESQQGMPFYQIILHLIPGATIESAINAATKEAIAQAVQANAPALDVKIQKIREKEILEMPEIGKFLSVLLYLCSSGADISGRDGAVPVKPRPVKTKNGLRIFPPAGPTAWEVGYHVGAAMRQYAPSKPAERDAEAETHAAPRPHIRRAHWHTYILGKKAAQEKTRRVYWLPPIPVGVAKNLGIIPTIKKIMKGKNHEEKK